MNNLTHNSTRYTNYYSINNSIPNSIQSKIGFIGIGQCGSNIAQLFEQLNYTCLCVNSSEKDFKPLQTKYNYCTPNTDGCNHDRRKAIQILQQNNNYKKIILEIKDKLFDKEILFFIFSTGGGTGSGFSPILIELLKDEFLKSDLTSNKTICAIPVLPSTQEKSYQIQYNSYECYKSLSQIESIGSVFTLDNSNIGSPKIDNKFALNQEFVNLFHTAISIPNHTHISGNIDTAELLNIFSQRGNAIITSFPNTDNQSNNNQSNICTEIIRSWESNIFTPIHKDKNIVYLTLSLNQELTNQQYQDLEKYIGTWEDKFSNINTKQNITILSGLTFPIDRIKQIVDLCNKDKSKIISNKNNAQTNKIDIEFQPYETVKPTPKQSLNADILFNKFMNL
jgi:cell division GTPase FtsZ